LYSLRHPLRDLWQPPLRRLPHPRPRPRRLARPAPTEV